MRAIETIPIIAVISWVNSVVCQDGFNGHDMLRLQQMANNGQIESIAGYNSNPNSQTFSAMNVQYSLQDDNKYEDYNRADRGRKKIYRIKNPFSQQDDEKRENVSQDSTTSDSNQYTGLAYSLPPEDFLKQMRAENLYRQQQQQPSTPNPMFSYTATPQPQFMYSTSGSYDQPTQSSQQDSRSYNTGYNTKQNTFQYNNPNSYNTDVVNSTPAPTFLSTQANQYISTPTNAYVSASSPIYMTSAPNLQPYVSSPYSQTQSGTIDYSNRVSTLASSLQHYENNAVNNNRQSEHYGSESGSRYSNNVPNQYQSLYASSTASPVSSPYSEEVRDSSQGNALNFNSNALPKSSHDLALSPYHGSYYGIDQQDNRQDTKNDGFNKDYQYNQLYYNYAKPDNQQLNNIKTSRDLDQGTEKPAIYSHGDYGWRLYDQKPSHSSEISSITHSEYHNSDNDQKNQLNFQMDSIRPYNYNQISKSSSEQLEAEEFARAAAKAHENYKQQLDAIRFSGNQFNSNNSPTSSNSYLNSNIQSEFVTPSPYYSMNMRENSFDNKLKNPFDHNKAIQNIIPLADVSSAVPITDKRNSKNNVFDANDKYSLAFYNKEQTTSEQTKQYTRPLSESYYKDKNNMYSISFNPEHSLASSEKLKPSYHSNTQSMDINEYMNYVNNKRFTDDLQRSKESPNQAPSYLQGNVGVSGNSQPQNVQHSPSSDASSFININDIPSRLVHNLNLDTIRLQNMNFEQGNIPSPLPVRINQNVETHQLDVTSDFLNKLLANKHQNRAEGESQANNLFATINGFRVANPFNLDLRLVEEMLKGKSARDNNQVAHNQDTSSSRLQPMKLDVSQLQQLLKNDNNIMGLNSGFSTFSNPLLDLYSSNRYPFQGVKYSRSAEETENIPITDPFIMHPIGAVIEEDNTSDKIKDDSAISVSNSDTSTSNEDKLPKFNNRHQRTMGRFSHNPYYRKYPTFKHPLMNRMRTKGVMSDKTIRRRRINRSKIYRGLKPDLSFENENNLEESKRPVSILLKPPPVSEDRIDVVEDQENAEDATNDSS
ncbi:GATA zinc finger domain-containing protein 14-like [Leptidea sinapis]|uniref:GATA zinc finger domain-containing protein 14-like n=1 Tax=Leptidea sinapis TaxID=189913 RepID=UPI0021275480|nr:GATA zinc finger domain-containing protein 14-like [Leptidea sinapis]